MIQDGYYVNLGDPFISFRVSESKCEQVRKDKDVLISKRESELLIVLGVWESQAHGEGAAEMMIGGIRLASTCTQRHYESEQ